jgi:hypothetical protein
MDERRVFRLRVDDLETVRCRRERRSERDASVRHLVTGDQDQLQRGYFIAPGGDLALVKRCGGQEHVGVADLHARADRLGPEGGKKRREHHAGLQRADGRRIELGHPAHHGKQRIALFACRARPRTLAKRADKPRHVRVSEADACEPSLPNQRMATSSPCPLTT